MKKWLGGALALAAVAVAGILALGRHGTQEDARMAATWRESLGGMAYLERYPAEGPNAVALALEGPAARLGIQLVAGEPEDRPLPSQADADRFSNLRASLKGYWRTLADHSGGPLPELPPEVEEFLDAGRGELVQMASVLAGGEAPRWESNLALGFEAPVPHLVGLYNLASLMAADAALLSIRGEPDGALRNLDAVWSLTAAADELPYLIGHMVAQLSVRAPLPLLRNLCEAPDVWQERLRQVDLRDGFLRSLQAEAWVSLYSAGLDRIPTWQGLHWQLTPVVRWGLRDHARRLHAMTVELAETDPVAYDPDVAARAAQRSIPRWHFVSRELLPNMWASWPRAARAELSAELTALVLAERSRLAAGGQGAASEQVASRVAGLDWLLEREGGETRISLSGDVAHPGANPLPLTQTVRASDCAVEA